MKVTIEEDSVNKIYEVSNFNQVKSYLNRLDPINSPFIILESVNGNYLQCVGDKNKLSIEVRFYSDDIFKHYVIGTKDQSKTWDIIKCKVGPIRVLKHEVFKIDDAIKIYESFFDNGIVPETYNKRNITKMFIK
jgi:hypothetical protein